MFGNLPVLFVISLISPNISENVLPLLVKTVKIKKSSSVLEFLSTTLYSVNKSF